MKRIHDYKGFLNETQTTSEFVDSVERAMKDCNVTGTFTCSKIQRKNGNFYVNPSLEELKSSLERTGLDHIVLVRAKNHAGEDIFTANFLALKFQFCSKDTDSSKPVLKRILRASSEKYPMETPEEGVAKMRELIDKWVHREVESFCDIEKNVHEIKSIFKEEPIQKYGPLASFTGIAAFCKQDPELAKCSLQLILAAIFYCHIQGTKFHMEVDTGQHTGSIPSRGIVSPMFSVENCTVYLGSDTKIIDGTVYRRMSYFIADSDNHTSMNLSRITDAKKMFPKEMYEFLLVAAKSDCSYQLVMDELHRKRGQIATKKFGI